MRWRVVAIVEVQTVALGLEPEALVEHHRGVVHRHMQSDVLPLTGLYQVVEHHPAQPSAGEVRVDHQERDVSLVHLHIRGHEPTAHHHLAVQGHHGEVGVLQAVRYVHWPEEEGEEGAGCPDVLPLQVAEVQGARAVGWVLGVGLAVVSHHLLQQPGMRGRDLGTPEYVWLQKPCSVGARDGLQAVATPTEEEV